MGGGGKCTKARGTHSARRADLHPQSTSVGSSTSASGASASVHHQSSVGSKASAAVSSASAHHQSLRPVGMAQELCQAELSTLSAVNHQFSNLSAMNHSIHAGNQTRCIPCIQRRPNPHSCAQSLFAGTILDSATDPDEGAQPAGLMPGNLTAVDTVDATYRLCTMDSDDITDAATLEAGMTRCNPAALNDEDTWMADRNAVMTDIRKVPRTRNRHGSSPTPSMVSTSELEVCRGDTGSAMCCDAMELETWGRRQAPGKRALTMELGNCGRHEERRKRPRAVRPLKTHGTGHELEPATPPTLTHDELRRHENSHARALEDKTDRAVAATLILEERRLRHLGKMRNAAMWTGRRRRGGRARRNAAAKLTLKAWTRRTRWYVLYIKIRRCVHMKQERLSRTAQMERCFTRPPD